MNEKFKLNIKVLLTFVTIFCIIGCDDAKYNVIDSRIYIAESKSLSYESKKITIDEQGATVTVTPRSGKNVAQDTEVELGINEKALEIFNAKNGTNYLALPKGSYTFSQNKVLIKKGESLAATVNVIVDPLTKEMIDSGDKYAYSDSIVMPRVTVENNLFRHRVALSSIGIHICGSQFNYLIRQNLCVMSEYE